MCGGDHWLPCVHPAAGGSSREERWIQEQSCGPHHRRRSGSRFHRHRVSERTNAAVGDNRDGKGVDHGFDSVVLHCSVVALLLDSPPVYCNSLPWCERCKLHVLTIVPDLDACGKW
jgi:hypothetical protein